MKKTIVLALLALIMEAPVAAAQEKRPSETVGEWGAWRGSCSVDPFEGPRCFLITPIPKKTKKSVDIFRPVFNNHNFVRYIIAPKGNVLEIHWAEDGYHINRMLSPAGKLRVDDNDIWEVRISMGVARIRDDSRSGILSEMTAGKGLYVQNRTYHRPADSTHSPPGYERYSLKGFSAGLNAVTRKFGDLLEAFNSNSNEATAKEDAI